MTTTETRLGKIDYLTDQTWEEACKVHQESLRAGKKLCVEVKDRDDPNYPWTTNQKTFTELEDAVAYAHDLAGRWMALCKWQVAISKVPRDPVPAVE